MEGFPAIPMLIIADTPGALLSCREGHMGPLVAGAIGLVVATGADLVSLRAGGSAAEWQSHARPAIVRRAISPRGELFP